MENKNITLPEYPSFEDVPVSTKTFIVTTNLTLDIKKLHEFLPITEYMFVPKKRGRKKKNNLQDPNRNIPDGSIITLDLANKIRGVILKKKKKKDGKESIEFFRNSMTVVMIVSGKKINFKISRNGKFQMTGCKEDKHAEDCLKYIWEYIKDSEDIYTLPEKQNFKAIFIPAMRNIDFSLGFVLDREKLDEFFNTKTEYYSLLETSIGYTGVNIKIPVTKSITDLKLKEITYKDKKWCKPKKVPYQVYLDQLKPKEQQKKLDQERFNTFLVFHSGKTICSSMCEEFSRDVYYEFLEIIKNNYLEFQERLSCSIDVIDGVSSITKGVCSINN
jgi:TATA-box binding protein (TBP) (component of TFIID and TFIIIB)